MSLKLKPLDEQVIVITGASSGIGLVTARAAAARGAKVFLVARSAEALADAVAGIAAAGGTADYAVADVGDAAQVEAAATKAIARFGRIDTWVNDAGVAIYAKLVDTPLDEHERLIRTNYFGAVNGAMAALPHLGLAGGALVTVGSVVSDMPSPLMGVYAASKHAVRAYIQTLRIELQAAGSPVSVTLVKPAGIDTPIAQHAPNHEGGEAQVPPPSYDPKLVADAILDAAVRRRREITVGGAGRAQVLFAEHFPALFERLAPLAAAAFIDRTKTQPGPSNLFATARTGHERSGENNPRQTSLYTSAMLHPKTATLLAIAGGALGALAVARMRGRRIDYSVDTAGRLNPAPVEAARAIL